MRAAPASSRPHVAGAVRGPRRGAGHREQAGGLAAEHRHALVHARVCLCTRGRRGGRGAPGDPGSSRGSVGSGVDGCEGRCGVVASDRSGGWEHPPRGGGLTSRAATRTTRGPRALEPVVLEGPPRMSAASRRPPGSVRGPPRGLGPPPPASQRGRLPHAPLPEPVTGHASESISVLTRIDRDSRVRRRARLEPLAAARASPAAPAVAFAGSGASTRPRGPGGGGLSTGRAGSAGGVAPTGERHRELDLGPAHHQRRWRGCIDAAAALPFRSATGRLRGVDAGASPGDRRRRHSREQVPQHRAAK